jgi:hypothetical protein
MEFFIELLGLIVVRKMLAFCAIVQNANTLGGNIQFLYIKAGGT